jgi:hypothetical protein
MPAGISPSKISAELYHLSLGLPENMTFFPELRTLCRITTGNSAQEQRELESCRPCTLIHCAAKAFSNDQGMRPDTESKERVAKERRAVCSHQFEVHQQST